MSNPQPIPFRASAESPCPVCQAGTKGCSATADGLHLCRGEPADADWVQLAPPDGDGFAGYRRDRPLADTRRRARKAAAAPSPPPPPPAPSPGKDWSGSAAEYARLMKPGDREGLAAALGLPADVLAALGVGVSEWGPGMRPVFSFPEVDAGGVVIGINQRFADGSKKLIFGGHRGLSVPAGWADRPGPVYVVEGASDTLAMTAAGLAAVGRPSNSGGVEHLVGLFASLPADRDVIILGENDRKENGSWPGRDGAETVAGAVARRLNRPVRWALPPAEAKDVRAWLTADGLAGVPWAERGQRLAEALGAGAVVLPTAAEPEGDDPARWDRDPENCPRLAAAYLATVSPAGEPLRLRYWRDDFHEWRGGCYHTVTDKEMRARVHRWVDAEFVRVHRLEVAAWERKGDGRGKRPTVRNVTKPVVTNVLAAVEAACKLPDDLDAPAWVDGAAGPDPRQLLAVRNGLVDVAAGTLHPPTAAFFGFAVSPLDYDPAAPPPAAWLDTLLSFWPDDAETRDALQEVCGYLLTGDTRYQKMFLLIGGSRSGKGAILRVVRELIGERNVASTSLSLLSNDFGLSGLIGKSVAVLPDVRVSGRADIALAVEQLLKISGEDAVAVNRKNRDLITVRLPTRFVLASNELPRLPDSSEALFNRMVLLKMTNTFLGREDTGLEGKLLAELPGILLWAMCGLRRLRARGRFVQPAAGREDIADLRELGSPVGAFVRERCRVEAAGAVTPKELYDAWRKWCEENGRREPGTLQVFGRDVAAAVPTVRMTRPRVNGVPVRTYAGIRLLSIFETNDDTGEPADHADHEAGRSERPSRRNFSDLTATDPGDPHAPRLHPLQPITREEGDQGAFSRARVSHNGVDRGSCGSPGSAQNGCESWLYVSARLDVTHLPADALPVVWVGTEEYYRLSPAVLVFFEAAGDQLARRNPPPDQIEAYSRGMVALYRFAEEHWPAAEIDAARAAGAKPLPSADAVVL